MGRRDEGSYARTEPRRDRLRGRDTSPHREIDAAHLERMMRLGGKRRGESGGKADHDARSRGAADALVYRQSSQRHHDVGQDAAADPGKSRGNPDHHTGHMAKSAAGGLLCDRMKALWEGKTNGEEEAHHGKG